jgi:hypothetical protein
MDDHAAVIDSVNRHTTALDPRDLVRSVERTSPPGSVQPETLPDRPGGERTGRVV